MRKMRDGNAGAGESKNECGECGWKCEKRGKSGLGCKESRWELKYSDRNNIE